MYGLGEDFSQGVRECLNLVGSYFTFREVMAPYLYDPEPEELRKKSPSTWIPVRRSPPGPSIENGVLTESSPLAVEWQARRDLNGASSV